MSDFWQKAENKLRDYEQQEQFDLFSVGYLIPQVALAQESWQEGDDPLQTLVDYVQYCIKQDNLNDDDIRQIEEVLHSLQ